MHGQTASGILRLFNEQASKGRSVGRTPTSIPASAGDSKQTVARVELLTTAMSCTGAQCCQHYCSRVLSRSISSKPASYTVQKAHKLRHSKALRPRHPSRTDGACDATHRRGMQIHASVSESTQADETKVKMPYEHVMLALVDPNPYLSDGSKQAVSAAVTFGQSSATKVTVTLLEAEQLAEEDRKKQVETVMWHFQQKNFTSYEVLQKDAGKVAVTIGDLADEVGANLVIMSVESIHAKVVDANLLVEFVPCPMLLLP